MALPVEELPFELASVAQAHRYQEWVFSSVEPMLGSRVLEVGAGIGTMTKWLSSHSPTVATDVDETLISILRLQSSAWAEKPTDVVEWNPVTGPFDAEWAAGVDTVVSFNVLEHIPDDVNAVRGMAELLRRNASPGRPARIVLFVPAHQWAYGSLDEVFDHYRRYSKTSLRSVLSRAGLAGAAVSLRYFNTVGLPGWITLGKVLKTRAISLGSVRASERIVPASRRLDRWLHSSRVDVPLGQSILCAVDVPR